jgi:hypothetical protein
MANFTVVYDANVLYPAPLRDFLMRRLCTFIQKRLHNQTYLCIPHEYLCNADRDV